MSYSQLKPTSSSASPVAISFQKAVKSYGASKIIGPVNFDVRKGEVVGFLGPNGSGKTTCIRMMLGLIRPTSGKVEVNGLNPISDHVRSLRDVAYSPELPNLQTFLTPSELLTLVLHELSFPSLDKRREVKRVLELAGLAEYSDIKIGKLSKGMVQRLSVAQALIGNPQILVLDEPMIGLDPAGSAHFRDLFRQFSRKEGGTVFMSSHIMSEVESLCTSIAIIHSGKILFRGSVEEAIQGTLRNSLVIVESSKLADQTITQMRGVEGVLEVRQGGSDSTPTMSSNDRHSVLEVIVRANWDEPVRASLSEVVIRSGAKLYTIKRGDNLLERAYIEALRDSEAKTGKQSVPTGEDVGKKEKQVVLG
jgi:ABC-2 type transport system ATP-binding protein